MKIPTREQHEALLESWAAARAAELANPSERMLHLRQTTSLRAWLTRCEKAEICHVPAVWGPDVLWADIEVLLDDRQESGSLGKANQWLSESLSSNNMWRWDFCSPLALKSDMGQPSAGKPKICAMLDIDDPRFIDITYDIGLPEIGVCIRPWVRAERIDDYPVEFRVFAFHRPDGSMEYSVSSYYPQRPLPEHCRAGAIECVTLTDKLVKGCGEFFPHGFTADFIRQDNGRLLYLEGGPGWGHGSHPCCIDPKKMEPGRVVLAAEWDAH